MSKPKVLIDLAEYERIKARSDSAAATLAEIDHDTLRDAERWRILMQEHADFVGFRSDAELGRLVRQMPEKFKLRKLVGLNGNGWTWQCGAELPPDGDCSYAYSPEEALRAAIEVKDSSA